MIILAKIFHMHLAITDFDSIFSRVKIPLDVLRLYWINAQRPWNLQIPCSLIPMPRISIHNSFISHSSDRSGSLLSSLAPLSKPNHFFLQKSPITSRCYASNPDCLILFFRIPSLKLAEGKGAIRRKLSNPMLRRYAWRVIIFTSPYVIGMTRRIHERKREMRETLCIDMWFLC